MNNSILYILLMIIVAIVLIVVAKGKEKLSLSQFPIPTCSTCKSCTFYNCGKCGTIYQQQNKLGQACCGGGTTIYPTKITPSCYKQTLKGSPQVGEVRTCKEPFGSAHNAAMIGFKKLPEGVSLPVGTCAKVVQPQKGSCASCDGSYTCLEAGSTFDSGSTMARNLPCPVPFPPVLGGSEPVVHKQMMHLSVRDVHTHLERGDLLVVANKGDVIDYTMKKLQEHTLAQGRQGYPDFYYIDGPVIVMRKVDGRYYWMIDYPIKYNPENFEKYVNSSTNWNIAKTAYNAGRRLMNMNAPAIFFRDAPGSGCALKAAAASCIAKGRPQSTTDYYYPGCSKKSCLWGPKYGSGNWLTRV